MSPTNPLRPRDPVLEMALSDRRQRLIRSRARIFGTSLARSASSSPCGASMPSLSDAKGARFIYRSTWELATGTGNSLDEVDQ